MAELKNVHFLSSTKDLLCISEITPQLLLSEWIEDREKGVD